MPKFILHLEQYVQEVATIEVEADSFEEAKTMYENDEVDEDVFWEDGNDSDGAELVKITQKGEMIWERQN